MQARQPQPQTLPLRSRAGSFAWLRWGGAGVSATSSGLRMPHPRLAYSSGGGFAPRWDQCPPCWRRATSLPLLARWQDALPVVPPSAHPATVRRPPKACRSMFRCSGSSHRADWFGCRLVTNAPAIAFARKPSGGEHSGGHEPRQPLHFVPAVVTPHARPPEDEKCSAAHEAREKGEPACAAEGSVYEPPAALIAAWLEKERLVERGKNGWEKMTILQPPSRLNPGRAPGRSQRKRES